MRTRRIAAALGLWLALVGAAAAEDFTFVVPVQVSNVPPAIARLAVACAVINSSPTPGREPLGIIGNGVSFVPVSGGAFNGDVTVQLNANLRENAGFADHYVCYIAYLGEATRADGTAVVYNPTQLPFIPLDRAAPYVVTTGHQPLH